MLHPNVEQAEEAKQNLGKDVRAASEFTTMADGKPQPFSWAKSGFVNWFLRVDETHIKPFLIRNYDRLIQQLEDEYQDQLKINFVVDDAEKIAERVEILRETQSAMGRAASYNVDPNDPSALLLFDRNLRGSVSNMPRTQSQFNPTARALGLDTGFGQGAPQTKARAASDFNKELSPNFV